MEFNFIHNSLPDTDQELFFGPLQADDTFNHFDDNSIMAHIMVVVGIFSSVSQARKNGWNKPIPKGFTDITVGKLKHRVCILNTFEGDN